MAKAKETKLKTGKAQKEKVLDNSEEISQK